jgi:hypothetical protein
MTTSPAAESYASLRPSRTRSVPIFSCEGTTKQELTTFRKNRDAQLDMPALILPAIQINIRAREFPGPQANGTAYLRSR